MAKFIVGSVIQKVVLLCFAVLMVEGAPVIRLKPKSFPSVAAELIKTNVSCPFYIDSDINENRIPAKIDRIKCAVNKNDDCRGHCDEKAGFECVQAVMAVNVTYLNRMDDAAVMSESSSDGDRKQVVIKSGRDEFMYSVDAQQEQIEVGCFCANMNSDINPAHTLEHKKISD